MRELRELKLPQLVEARKRQSGGSDFEFDPYAHPLHLSQTSTASSDHSPVTPTFSLRGHFRFPSSTSSLASSPPLRSSMEGFAAKRPLTEVREEPQEREGEVEMFNVPSKESHGKW